MKTKMRIFTLVSLLCAVLLTGCKKDDSDYDLNSLQGTWRMTEVFLNGKWMDITDPSMSKIITPASFTFTEDLGYVSTGHFGDITAKYMVDGNTVIAYAEEFDAEKEVVVKKERIKYSIISLTATDFEFNMTTDKGYYLIRCKR